MNIHIPAVSNGHLFLSKSWVIMRVGCVHAQSNGNCQRDTKSFLNTYLFFFFCLMIICVLKEKESASWFMSVCCYIYKRVKRYPYILRSWSNWIRGTVTLACDRAHRFARYIIPLPNTVYLTGSNLVLGNYILCVSQFYIIYFPIIYSFIYFSKYDFIENINK